MAEYKWRPGGPKPAVAAQVFGEFIEEFTEGLEVPLLDKQQREKILKAAEKRADIRDLFVWDNKKAGHLYRLDQLRHYCGALQAVVVEVEEAEPISQRTLYSVNIDGRRGYVDRETIKGNRDLTKQLIETARRELESYITRFQTITSFGIYLPSLRAVLDQMRDDLDAAATSAARRRSRPPKFGEDENRPNAP